MTTTKVNPAELQEHAAQAARLLKAMSNEARLMVMCILLEGEHSVSSLEHRIGLGQSALSQHLARLRRDGLVTTRRQAQTIYYSLASRPVERVMSALYESYCQPADEPTTDH